MKAMCRWKICNVAAEAAGGEQLRWRDRGEAADNSHSCLSCESIAFNKSLSSSRHGTVHGYWQIVPAH